MNILATCAGRRGYLITYFKEALEGKGKVVALNSEVYATSMIEADEAIVAPKLFEVGYVEFVLEVCKKHKINLLVSLFDMELPILAARRKDFENIGVVLAISSPEVIKICNDKLKTVSFLKKSKLLHLESYSSIDQAKAAINNNTLKFPVFVKPRWGMGSISVERADSLTDLEFYYEKVKTNILKSYLKYYNELDKDNCVLIQSGAKGDEFGLDVVNDFNGRYVTTLVKKKISMRAGETDIAKTMDIPELSSIGEQIANSLKHIGNLDVDVFWDGKQAYVLELNARFGGGYPASHIAGANLPLAYVKWAKNESASSDCFTVENNVITLKGITLLKG